MEIGNGGEYTVNGSITAIAGNPKITVNGTGVLNINGNISIEGEFKIEGDGEVNITSCDTLRIGGRLEVKGNANLNIAACAVVIVDGDFRVRDDVIANIDGTVNVAGDVDVRNDAVIDGSGNIEAEGDIDISNNGSILGGTTGCSPGPCETGSGQGLPIHLLSFEAEYIDPMHIAVSWKTLSEVNNEFFSIQISGDSRMYRTAKTILGAGNSYDVLSYRVILDAPENEIAYLRLKQTDFDGKYEVFRPISIKKPAITAQKAKFSIYPNPSQGNELFLHLEGLQEDQLSIDLYDLKGQHLMNKTIAYNSIAGSSELEIRNGLFLKPGYYILRLVNGSNSEVFKYLVR